MKTNYEITSGPSKMELFDNLKYSCSGSSQVKILFGFIVPTDPTKRISLREVKLTGISLEDGSGESFIIKGDIISNGQNMPFEGWYNTKTRKGTIIRIGRD